MLRARGKYGKYRKEWICWDNFYIGWFFIVLCFNSVNIKHQLKSKLACAVCSKSMKFKYGTGAMATAENMFLFGYNMKIVEEWWSSTLLVGE